MSRSIQDEEIKIFKEGEKAKERMWLVCYNIMSIVGCLWIFDPHSHC